MVAPEVTRRPWERQPGESSKAFRAFAFYRDLGPTRSLVKVGAYLGETGARTGSPESIAHGLEEWSVRWRWVERARAYELHQDRRRLEAREQTQREMEERHLAAAGALLYAVIARARGAQRPP